MSSPASRKPRKGVERDKRDDENLMPNIPQAFVFMRHDPLKNWNFEDIIERMLNLPEPRLKETNKNTDQKA